MKKKKLVIALIAIVLVVAVVAVIASMSKTRPLEITGFDNTAVAYIGQEKDVSVQGEGITEDMLSMVEWSADDTAVLAVDGSKVKGVAEGETVLHAALKKGLRHWEGELAVKSRYLKLDINGNKKIKIYVGDKEKIKVDGDIPVDKVKWKSGDKSLLKVSDGTLVPKKAGETYVSGTYDSGNGIYEGTCSVIVKYREVSFSNGEFIKGSSGSAPVKINAPSDEHLYVFFKAKGSGKDFAIMVKKGKSASVSAPLGTYEVYYASGTRWYGKKHLFGDETIYVKADGTVKFYQEGNVIHGIELTLYQVANGNLGYETIGEDEFPE